MTVSAIAARALPTGTAPTPGPLRVLREGEGGSAFATGRPTTGVAFSNTLRMAVDRVDGAQKTADAEVQAFVAGESDNVHDAMIAMNEAQLHFQLLTEVRNKLLDGYQEIMRMQV